MIYHALNQGLHNIEYIAMRHFMIATIVLLLTACQPSRPVATDYDTDADFSRYHRYAWLDERSGADPAFNPLLAQRVKDAIGATLAARQFETVSDKSKADFLVRYYLKTDEKTEEPKARGGVSLGSFGGNVGMGVSLNFPLGGKVVEQRAQILIDFVNNQDQKMVWRGSRSMVLKGEEPDAIAQQIRVIVEQIIEAFPPK